MAPENADGPGSVDETYVAALQHDLYEGDGIPVGVARRPAGWFHGLVDENHPELGPPDHLLEETKARHEDLKMAGMCEEGAHNAAWEEVRFEERYREYLNASDDVAATLSDLAGRVRDGEDLALVCVEGDGKRCHRHLLVDRLRERL